MAASRLNSRSSKESVRLMRMFFLICALSLITPFGVMAGVHFERVAQANISEAQAASIAQREVSGKVLNVQKSQQGERIVFKVKILTESGRVTTVTVDANNGQVLGR